MDLNINDINNADELVSLNYLALENFEYDDLRRMSDEYLLLYCKVDTLIQEKFSSDLDDKIPEDFDSIPGNGLAFSEEYKARRRYSSLRDYANSVLFLSPHNKKLEHKHRIAEKKFGFSSEDYIVLWDI